MQYLLGVEWGGMKKTVKVGINFVDLPYRYLIVVSGLILLMIAEGRINISRMAVAAPILIRISCQKCMDIGALSKK